MSIKYLQNIFTFFNFFKIYLILILYRKNLYLLDLLKFQKINFFISALIFTIIIIIYKIYKYICIKVGFEPPWHPVDEQK